MQIVCTADQLPSKKYFIVMVKLGLLTLILFGSFTVCAQNSVSFKFIDDEKEPIMAVSVYFSELKIGGDSDEQGELTVSNIPDGSHEVEISLFGFEEIDTVLSFPLSNPNITLELEESAELLDGVEISVTRSTRTIERIPTRIEFIGGEELGEKAIMNAANISMVLRESTGIQMQQTSINSGNTSIRIQGLDGRYSQLLKDGFPLFNGFAGGLSIMQIPPLDLAQFGIIKGSSSTLYGGGAISGLVNMISKTPESSANLEAMLTQTHALGTTANLFASKRNEKIGYTLYASGNYQAPYDPEGDGYSNYGLTKTLSLNPKLFIYPSDSSVLWIGVNGTLDERTGGNMSTIESAIDTSGLYNEINVSKRLNSQIHYQKKMKGNKTATFKNSVSFFDRDQRIPEYIFSGNQLNTFTEVNLVAPREKTEWITGLNAYSYKFDETSDTLNRDLSDFSAGAFVNNILDISEKLVLESGMRLDYSQNWGAFYLPKVSLLFKPNDKFASRLGGGLGYKTPDLFTEEAESRLYRNILPIQQSTLVAERSYGLNMDFNYTTTIGEKISFSINQLFYYTAIDNSLLLQSTSDPNYFLFENANGLVESKGAETNIKFKWGDFRWFINYALIDARLSYLPNNPVKPLTAKHNAGSVFMLETEKWRIGYEVYYTGTQFLSNGQQTNDFFTMGLMTVRNFEWGSVFANFENFTDRRQSRFGPMVNNAGAVPEFAEIYAPTDGIIISFGLIFKPFGAGDDDDD